MHLFLKLTNLIANNCIKLLLLTSEQNLCEMALVKNAARNGAVCYHHDSKEIFVLLCLFLPQGPTLYGSTRSMRNIMCRKYEKLACGWRREEREQQRFFLHRISCSSVGIFYLERHSCSWHRRGTVPPGFQVPRKLEQTDSSPVTEKRGKVQLKRYK